MQKAISFGGKRLRESHYNLTSPPAYRPTLHSVLLGYILGLEPRLEFWLRRPIANLRCFSYDTSFDAFFIMRTANRADIEVVKLFSSVYVTSELTRRRKQDNNVLSWFYHAVIYTLTHLATSPSRQLTH